MLLLVVFVSGLFVGGFVGIIITSLMVGAHDCAETLETGVYRRGAVGAMKDKRRGSTHSKKHRRGKTRKGNPKAHQGPKHRRELLKRLRRTGQLIFGDKDNS